VANDRKLMTTYRGGPLQSSIPVPESSDSRGKPFHILSTTFLEGTEVLVSFSDGSAAIFEAEELEKLRPKPKQMFAMWPLGADAPVVLEPAKSGALAPELDHSLVLDSAVA
jgi:hypothetical protein